MVFIETKTYTPLLAREREREREKSMEIMPSQSSRQDEEIHIFGCLILRLYHILQKMCAQIEANK